MDQLPKDYTPIMVRNADFNADKMPDFLVVAASKKEQEMMDAGDDAPKRWVYVFLKSSSGNYVLAGKNDNIAFAADQGGQCDPLLDTGGLVVKGPYFTVENAVNCGEHWTDYITFKLDKASGRFLFHKRIFENWVLNPSNNPDAPALIRNRRTVTSPKQGLPPVLLERYLPN
jgi:hypothetical protein